ncbi:MAG TPA: DUF2283 domain-containing protein [Candidatus Binataceae bacterium]|jgi:hypothetical protein|nr:DUF2283 domain-containing protein [Candidatus Binataceae bacterium]
MEKIKVVHDTTAHTLTVWFDEPQSEAICEETAEEVILMKNAAGRVIGFELLHYRAHEEANGLAVEAIVHSEP